MRIALVGLGHAHLHVAAQAETFRRRGLDLTLIDPGTFWYSSIGSGLLGGRYERADDVIEAADFAARHGIAQVAARATGLDRARRVVLTDGPQDGPQGGEVSYDLVSFNVGSHVAPAFPVADDANVWTAKPIASLLALRERLEAAFARGERVRWVTVGGNYSGCELTCNAVALARACGGQLDATLVTSSGLIDGEPAGAQRAMRRRLESYGVTLRLGERVDRIERDAVIANTSLPFDHALVATGLQAAPPVRDLGLDADSRGLLVTDRLHTLADDRVFAAGDCARILGHDLPKVGVFGVRAAPVLARNLLARAAGEPLERYRPQRVWFAAQNLGDGTGLATWGPLWWRGRSALALKDWNDRRFMDRYRA